MTIRVELSEWQVLRPSSERQLRGQSFDGQAGARRVAEQLSLHRLLTVLELRQGIELRTTSYVGSLTLGDLQINIKPKIGFDVLVTLFRYAYGLHDLRLLEQTEHRTEPATFQDLLIHQLAAEVARLVARGVFRQYRQQEGNLASPRGRINIHQLVAEGGIRDATIPCDYFDRNADNVLNQAVLAGLLFSTTQTSDLMLRTHLRRQAGILELTTTRRSLSTDLINTAMHSVSRLNLAYEPILRLIALLYAGTGLSFDGGDAARLTLPGYLFDMNDFFEQLVTRFLTENLAGYTVKAQHRLTAMMAYIPGLNPRKRHSPTPRPDIAILKQSVLVGLLDTKYRDLWENPLPRDMLYQLAVYALSQATRRTATILYPTTDMAAKDQAIEIRDPVHGASRAQVILRPIHMPTLAGAIGQAGAVGVRERGRLASRMLDGLFQPAGR